MNFSRYERTEEVEVEVWTVYTTIRGKTCEVGTFYFEDDAIDEIASCEFPKDYWREKETILEERTVLDIPECMPNT